MHRALTLYTYLTILQFTAIGLSDQGCVISQGQRDTGTKVARSETGHNQ